MLVLQAQPGACLETTQEASSLTLQRPFLESLHRQKLQNSHQGNPDLASSFLVGGWEQYNG